MTKETTEQDKAIAQIMFDWLAAHSHSTRYFRSVCCNGVYDMLHFDKCGVCGKPLSAPEDLRKCIDKIKEILQHAPSK